jgi:hypothetical protein
MLFNFKPALIRGVLIAERAYDRDCGLTTIQLARCVVPRPASATHQGYEQLLGVACRDLDQDRARFAQALIDEWPGLPGTGISREGAWHLLGHGQ